MNSCLDAADLQEAGDRSMNLDEIKEILDAICERDICEFELERGDEKIRIRRGPVSGNNSHPLPYIVVSGHSLTESSVAPAIAPGQNAVQPPQAASAAASLEAAKEKPAEVEDLVMVPAPIVGTFYEAASPGAPPFVQVGDRIEPGQVLCIIEAMKLMNEIEAEMGGVVVKRFVQNAQPVEYGEALFAIKANK
jgi:acetyl-CoA carboxylase biotin carboxyl carrier protein